MTRPLLIFDIGSTLLAASSGPPAKEIAAALGLTDAQRRTLNHALMTTHLADPDAVSAFIRLEFGPLEAPVDETVARVWAAQELDGNPAEGAAEALEQLRLDGYRLALLSNIWEPYLASTRRHFGEFFDTHIPAPHQIYSYRSGVMKPAPEIFRMVLDGAGATAEEAVMIGDSYDTDLAPAMALGIRTIWALTRPEREVERLLAVLNGTAPAPTRTVAEVVEVTGTLVEAVMASEPTRST